MYKLLISFLPLLFYLFFANNLVAQIKPVLGVNEIEYSYSSNFKSPDRLLFIMHGKPNYSNYFYKDLKNEIKRLFKSEDIKISFILKNNLIKQNNFNKNADYIFYLKVENFLILAENNGYDRIVKFDFSGKLTSLKINQRLFIFKSHVYAIHDINNQNSKVAKYLFDRVLSKQH